jgi:high-affinity iron transporter
MVLPLLSISRGRCLTAVLAAVVALTSARAAAAPADAGETPQTIVHLLDYVGADYPHFVHDGQVVNADEYREQQEFASNAGVLLKQLPPVPTSMSLADEADRLAALIEAKADGTAVSSLATQLRDDVIAAYQLAVAPKRAPDVAHGAQLFGSQCAACHGADGHGDGPAAAALQPKPTDFHDTSRMDEKSIYAIYNTISLGVDGTSMRPFKELSEEDRWALAFFVSTRAIPVDQLSNGESIWTRRGASIGIASLKGLVTVSPEEVSAQRGTDAAAAHAYLRAHPDALQVSTLAPLTLTRTKLDQVAAAYTQGRREDARQLAISAYLEGFELIEASLDNVDPALRADVERAMMDLRSVIAAGASVATVTDRISNIRSLLDRVDDRLSGGAISSTTLFFSSLLILLREGLEAILVLAAIIAFVVKTGRRDALPYIHVGWIAALILGAATWVLTTRLIDVSGASRETTEGVTALITAGMLFCVGYWLHNKAYANAWQTFIRNQIGSALERRTLWAMSGVAFLAVYREIVEIVLFYETLWAQATTGGHSAVLAGIVAAFVALALIGGAILKYSIRLPLGPFFVGTSILLALLAIVFVGNGMYALQEAGAVTASTVHVVSIPLLGVHPTMQGLLAQGAALALVVGAFVWARRQRTVTASRRA